MRLQAAMYWLDVVRDD